LYVRHRSSACQALRGELPLICLCLCAVQSAACTVALLQLSLRRQRLALFTFSHLTLNFPTSEPTHVQAMSSPSLRTAASQRPLRNIPAIDYRDSPSRQTTKPSPLRGQVDQVRRTASPHPLRQSSASDQDDMSECSAPATHRQLEEDEPQAIHSKSESSTPRSRPNQGSISRPRYATKPRKSSQWPEEASSHQPAQARPFLPVRPVAVSLPSARTLLAVFFFFFSLCVLVCIWCMFGVSAKKHDHTCSKYIPDGQSITSETDMSR
jgi:hypothetical protein